MSNVVKGAGRRKHAANQRHQQRTPLPPKPGSAGAEAIIEEAKRKIIAKRKPVAKSAPPTPAEDKPAKLSKPADFATAAEEAGWKVERIMEGTVKRVVAMRGDERIECAWDGEAKELPWWHTIAGHQIKFIHVSAAKRMLVVPPDVAASAVKPVTATRGKAAAGSTRRVKVSVPFSPKETSDNEVLEAVRGHELRWTNQFTDQEESAVVPADGARTRLDLDDLDDHSTRQLTFCDARGGGYRSLRLSALTFVSPHKIAIKEGK